jgi:predicted small lipoprotein YifL
MRWLSTLTMVRLAAVLLVMALAPLAGCGKRPGELTPPKGAENQYPRQYPSW